VDIINKEHKYLIKQKQRKAAKRRLMIFLATLTLVIGGCAAYGGFLLGTHASAKSEETQSLNKKYYTSIEIQKGDSLWSIAQVYMTDEYESIHDYINELKTINSLESDYINESGFLTVAYYM